MKRSPPWLVGIIDALKCVALIHSSTLATKNRLSVVMLDSILEISIRQYLQNVKKITLDPKEHRPRNVLFEIAKKNIDVPFEVWDHLNYHWNTRNPQYHQDANLAINDTVFTEFSDLVCFMLDNMFGIDSKGYLNSPMEELIPQIEPQKTMIDIHKIVSKLDAVIAVVVENNVISPKDVRDTLKKLGIRFRFSDGEIRSYLSRRYFYKDEKGYRRLSSFGIERLKKLEK